MTILKLAHFPPKREINLLKDVVGDNVNDIA